MKVPIGRGVKERYFTLNAVQKRVLEAFYSRIYAFDLNNIDFDHCKSLDSAINQWYSRNMLDTLYTDDLKEMFCQIPKVLYNLLCVQDLIVRADED